MIERARTRLTQNLNNGIFGVFDAAQAERDVPLISEWVDNSDLAPEVIASSVLKSQAAS